MVVVNTREGGRQARVLKVGHFNVDLDLNHPLAGKTLTFDIEIVDVRAATEEELAHGHAHGPDGHGHDHDHDLARLIGPPETKRPGAWYPWPSSNRLARR